MSATFTDRETPIGVVRIVEEDGAITRVDMSSCEGFVARECGQAGTSALLRWAAQQMDEYFAGTRTAFALPLRPQGTAFQRQAWQALCAIPYGQTRSYAQQARAVGRPTATRAIGAANGRTPIAIIVPCHRVIGSDGSLTGYAGGESVKRWLLRHEGAKDAVQKDATDRAQLALWSDAAAPS
jgi:methylated-DNA-[protein]-cysteine S-methyltransferase